MAEETQVINTVNTSDTLRVVTDNDFIVSVGLEKLSLKARKLLYVAISQCKKSDKEFYEFFITAKEFAQLMGTTEQNVYIEADNVTDELMATFLRIGKTTKKKGWSKRQLFTRCDYDDGVIYFKINPDMTNFLIQLTGGFTQPLLNDFIKMRSVYSMAIWHLMQREMHSRKPGVTDVIQFDLTLEELRAVTGTESKLKQISEFKNRCLDKALREIKENCGVSITYANKKEGRTVVGFTFSAVSVWHKDEKDISPETLAKVRAIRESKFEM